MALFDWLALLLVTVCVVIVASYILAMLIVNEDEDSARDQPFTGRNKP